MCSARSSPMSSRHGSTRVSGPLSEIAPASAAPRAKRAGRLVRLLSDPMGALGILPVLAVVLGAMFADVLTPYLPTKMAPRDRFLPPGAAHWLGTDQLGRDLLTRI